MKNTLSRRAMTLFSKEAMKKLVENRFSGEIMVRWENGVINDLDLSTSKCFDVFNND
jgi:hypothetical protein